MKNFLANVTDDSSYFNSFNLSNAGDFFQELNSKGLYLSSRKEKENRCLMFTSSINREIRKFQVVFVQKTAKKCTKKRDARAKLLFCQSKTIAFLPFLLPFPSSLLNYFFS